MSSQQAQNLKSQAGEAVGQAQIRKEEMKNNASGTTQTAMNMASQTAQTARETLVHTKDQAAGLIQQTGTQVKNMAQGATDAVRTTLGINTNDISGKQSHPTNPSTKI